MGDQTPVPSTSEALLVESTARWSTRYLDPNGFESQLTLEAESGIEVLKKAASAIAYLKESKCLPVSQSTQGFNSNHTGAVITQKAEKTGVMCPIHNVEMRLYEKGSSSWYAHKWDGKWCRGK